MDDRDDPTWIAESAERNTLLAVIKLIRWYADGFKITSRHDSAAKVATCEEIARMLEERFGMEKPKR